MAAHEPSPTPDHEALQENQADDTDNSGDLGSESGPGTSAENRVDEAIGGSDG